MNIVCSFYGFKPSEKDLSDHMPLIGEAAKRNAVLARSKVCIFFSNDTLWCRKLAFSPLLLPHSLLEVNDSNYGLRLT